MLLFRALLIAGCLSTLLLNGCGKSSNDNANVRALNLISGANDVKIVAGGTTILTGGSFESLSGFSGVGSGNQDFKVTLASSAGALVDVIYTLSSSIYFSFVTVGAPGSASAVLLADSYSSPGSNNVAFRVLNMSAVNPSVDAYLTAPDADLAAATPVVIAAVYGTPTPFVNTPAGNLELRMTTTGTKDVIYDASVALPTGTGQTVVAYGRGSSTLVNTVLLASNTNGAIVNNQLAQMKVANGTAVTAPLNVLVDGTAAVSNLAFAAVAPYQTLPAGTRQISVESSATPGATLLSISPNFVPATDTSIALSGAAGSLGALVLTDSNPVVAPGRAQVRIVNVSPDFAAVDVYANFGKLVSGLAANAASSYSLVDAASLGTPYRIDFNTAGTTNVALSVPGLVLASGHVYTMYLLGSGQTLAGVLTQDR
jgi:Domain of unknown function (DUF4397)